MPSHPQLTQAIALSNQGRNAEAVQLIRETAASGDPEALFVLGEMTWRGGLVEQDPIRGRTLIEYAASLGHASANLLLTNLLASGVAGKQNWEASIERLRVEARVEPRRRSMLDLVSDMAIDGNGNPTSLPELIILSDNPDVRLFEGLLSPAECDHLRQVTGDDFEPSMVYDSDRQLVRNEIRTSDGATIHWLIEDPAVVAINRRIAAISASKYENGEALALLRYAPGQQYHPHFDFVDGATNRRLQTALIYLNDDYEGGETRFMQTGLTIKGARGDVLLFRNDGSDGRVNPFSEHAGLPVTKGSKYLATRWIREARWIP